MYILESFRVRGYFRNMRFARGAFLLVFLFGAAGIFAQGVYLEKGSNGIGGEVRLALSAEGFEATEITAGYSIAGILDIGAGFTYTPGELGGFDSVDLRIAFDYSLNLIKQSSGVPLTLRIIGSYGLNDVTSEYLDNDNARRRGTGYTIGLDMSRNFRVARFMGLYVNLFVDYKSISYSTIGDTLDFQDHISNLYYGGGGGFLFVFPTGQTLALRTEMRADENLMLHIHPIVGVAFPQH
jgi:hypothetical protein